MRVRSRGRSTRPAFPEVIAVTATDTDDKLFKMANRWVRISRGGAPVRRSRRRAERRLSDHHRHIVRRSPVSGVAALILDRNRGSTRPPSAAS